MHHHRIAHRTLIAIVIILMFTLGLAPVKPVRAGLSQVFVSPDSAVTATCEQDDPCSLADGLIMVDPGGTLYAAGGTYTASSGDQVVLLDKSINFLGGWNGAPSGPVARSSHVSIHPGWRGCTPCHRHHRRGGCAAAGGWLDDPEW
ncbi:MAG: hypothetical protein JW704_12820 [Anaerolineaceae bacterium]|nr:hypothetical protein [Anaerolineaceae bacterium]